MGNDGFIKDESDFDLENYLVLHKQLKAPRGDILA